jgi:oligosaccharide translocation protein RFT1
MARVFFSAVLAKTSSSGVKRQSLEQVAYVLLSLLAIQLSFTIILWVFGFGYMAIVLQLLLPPQYMYTSAPNVLSAWIWYIPLLAVNGGLEAFLSSVANSEDLNKQSRYVLVL